MSIQPVPSSAGALTDKNKRALYLNSDTLRLPLPTGGHTMVSKPDLLTAVLTPYKSLYEA